jgi:hypothetical protein
MFKIAKWETVNVITEQGLTAQIKQFGNVYKVPVTIIVKEKKKRNGSIIWKCIVGTGFASEQVSGDYVLGLLKLKNYDELKNYRSN